MVGRIQGVRAGDGGSAMTEPTGASAAVAGILLSDVLCVDCILAKTGLELDPLLDAIVVLETHLRLTCTWGRCRLCSKKDRALLTLA
jgi:hypothetical protein